MDVQMPGIDGFETTTAMRKYERERGLPPVKIVGLTAHASTRDREKCLAAGMDDYLSKPFEPKKLRELLSRDGDNGNVISIKQN
jgi:CheY-like chemotaxis protein